jgi:hypothetical protein
LRWLRGGQRTLPPIVQRRRFSAGCRAAALPQALQFGQRALELCFGGIGCQFFQALDQRLAFGSIGLEFGIAGVEGGVARGKDAVDGTFEIGPQGVFNAALQGQ